MCAILYFFLMVCNKPHANPTIIYENIKEIHILAVGGNLEFPILSHVLLRRGIVHRTRNQVYLSLLPTERKVFKCMFIVRCPIKVCFQ